MSIGSLTNLHMRTVRLKCKGKHYYHEKCIEQWLKNKKHCPTCRQKLGKKRLKHNQIDYRFFVRNNLIGSSEQSVRNDDNQEQLDDNDIV